MSFNFAMRFDFRNPSMAGTPMADRYAAALDMADWADDLGCVSVVMAEHHAVDDGYIPSPLVLQAAMAARTKNAALTTIVVAPFYDPLRLAEDACVLDHLANGRLSLMVVAGYAHHEFAMFDVPMSERPKRVTEAVATLKKAFTGEPFEYRGRTVRVTPEPYQDGGPRIILGGSSEGAARRAARIADGYVPVDFGASWDAYADELEKLGKPHPGPYRADDSSLVTVAKDPEKAWEQLGPYFLYETNTYGEWQAEDGITTGYESIADLDALRTTGQYRILEPEEFVAEMKERPAPYALLHPLVGGTPPELAWESLRLLEAEVIPAFR